MMRGKKGIVLAFGLLVVLVLGAGIYGFASAGQKGTGGWAPAALSVGDIQVSTSADGRAVVASRTELSFVGSGTLAEIEVQEGQAVTKGQELAHLVSSKLADQLSQAQAAYAGAQAKLNQLKDGQSAAEIASKRVAVTNAQSAVDDAKAAYDYALAQYNSSSVSKEELLSKSSQLNNAKAAERTARAQVETATSAVSDAQASYDYTLGEYEAGRASEDLLISKQAQLDAAKGALGTANAQLENAKTAVDDAQASYDYTLSQYKSGQVSKTDLLAKKAQWDSAKSELKTSKAQLDLALAPPGENELKDAKAAVDQADAAVKVAQSALDETVLRAPFDGTVLAINGKVGEVIGSQGATGSAPDPVMVVGTAGMTVEVPVEEVDIAKIAVGQKVATTFDALEGRAFAGSVESITPSATVDQNGVTTYLVRAVVVNKDGAIKDGMSAQVDFVTQEATGVLRVPVKAVSSNGGQPSVMVRLNDGTVVSKQIEVGLTDGTYVEVKSGLSHADNVVMKDQAKTTQ